MACAQELGNGGSNLARDANRASINVRRSRSNAGSGVIENEVVEHEVGHEGDIKFQG